MHVLLVVNRQNSDAMKVSNDVNKWLTKKGIESTLAYAEDMELGAKLTSELQEKMESIAFICSFGGDGTLLKAARVAFANPKPILGFNFGHLGFLTGASQDTVFVAIEAALKRELRAEVRSSIRVMVEYEKTPIKSFDCLNDVVINRGASGKLLNFELSVNNSELANMKADGMIISTATGSTAYSLAAGGPLVSPSLRGMIITPLAPHTLVSRAMVTDEFDVVKMRMLEHKVEPSIYIDGQLISNESKPQLVTVFKNEKTITLLKYNSPDFYSASSQVFYRGRNVK